MGKNRVTAKSNVDTQIVPVMVTAVHRSVLKTDVLDNVVFRNDTVTSATYATGGARTIDFSSGGSSVIDRFDITTSGSSLYLTMAGIDDGEVKFIKINKTSGQLVSWDVWQFGNNIPQNAVPLTIATSVLYMVIRKGANYYCISCTDTAIPVSTFEEMTLLRNNYKYITPALLGFLKASESQKGIQENATDAEAIITTKDDKTITPKKWNTAFLHAVATSLEAVSKTIDNKTITPKKWYEVFCSYAATIVESFAGSVTDKFISPDVLAENIKGGSLCIGSGDSDGSFHLTSRQTRVLIQSGATNITIYLPSTTYPYDTFNLRSTTFWFVNRTNSYVPLKHFGTEDVAIWIPTHAAISVIFFSNFEFIKTSQLTI